MRVAVTGAEGFTGRYMTSALRARGHVPVALAADVTDAAALHEAVSDLRPDAVIHLAAKAFVDSTDFARFYAVNQVGTFNLLETVATVMPGAKVLLASSAQVYGAQAAGLLTEAQSVRPGNHYALSKAAMEEGSRFWADRLRITIARPFNYTGRGQEERYLIPKLVKHFRDRAARVELGNIDVRRDFGDVRAVADAYAGLIELDEVQTFNVSTGQLSSIREVIAMLEQMTGHRIEIGINPAFLRSNDVPELGGDNALLRTSLPDWKPESLADTLRWMIEE